MSSSRAGVLYAIAAFTTWGVFPIYWKQLEHVPALQLAIHRIAWSFVTMVLVFTVLRKWNSFRETALTWRNAGIYAVSGIAIAGNWLVYVWAINNGYIVECSLGYFINPLFNVLLGVVVLREKLRKWQWAAVVLAVLGVLVVAIAYAKFPWVAFSLAGTAGLYGLIKKQAPLSAMDGMTLETGTLFLPAVAYLIGVEANNSGVFLHTDVQTNLLLVLSGIGTLIPLLLFSTAARMIQLSMLGILMYIAPTLTFLIGIFIYNEPFSVSKLAGFILVWAALAVFTVEGIYVSRQQAHNTASDEEDANVQQEPTSPTTDYDKLKP